MIMEAERSQGISLVDMQVTPESVCKKLKNLNPNKAHGPDAIPSRVLKELHKELSLPLSTLFNKSITEGVIPKDWKEANVTAIFKKGSRSDPSNYRPVSLTCVTCKVLESLIRDVIVEYMSGYKLYLDCQHGFRQKRSCITQLLEVMEDLTNMIENRNTIDIIYLDFRKAFDTVPHERLLLKLKSYGISGNLLIWIKQFLNDRTQKVKVGKEFSKEKNVISGIPQGSVLGPVLFTIFINDLPEVINSTCKIFADDTKLYDSSLQSDSIQVDLIHIQEWSHTWQLYFNTEKCKVLHMGKNNPKKQYMMQQDNNLMAVNTCLTEKDLGVTFDGGLDFDIHISAAINKANQMLGIIRRCFRYLDNRSFLNLYKAMVRPHLEYGNIIWYPLWKRQSSAIEKVQRRATKMIPQLKTLSYQCRMETLGLPSLKARRTRGDLIQAYKIFNRIDDLDFNSFFYN